MGAEVIHHSIPAVLDVQYQCSPLDAADFHKADDMVDLSSPPILGSHSVTTLFSCFPFFLFSFSG